MLPAAALLLTVGAPADAAPQTSPVARWLPGNVTPEHRVDEHLFRLRTVQWVDVRATLPFALLHADGRGIALSTERDTAYPVHRLARAHRRLEPGSYRVRVTLPDHSDARLPYEVRFGPLRETVVLSSASLGSAGVSGEVINETAQPRAGIRVRVTYLDLNGDAVGQRVGAPLLAAVPSRAFGLFLLRGAAPQGTRRIRVDVVGAGHPVQLPATIIKVDAHEDYECAEPPEEHCYPTGAKAGLDVRGEKPSRNVVVGWAQVDRHGDVSEVEFSRRGDVAPGYHEQAITDGSTVVEAGTAAR